MYEEGLGVTVDSVEAERYYVLAAEKNHADAMERLGLPLHLFLLIPLFSSPPHPFSGFADLFISSVHHICAQGLRSCIRLGLSRSRGRSYGR